MPPGTDRPLDGLRVVDLGRHLPGPFATRMLFELGAEVIKVERPGNGDPIRQLPPFDGDPPQSRLFRALNAGKKSVALDLESASGRRAFEALVASADVVVDTFRPGTLDRLGYGPQTLLDAHPRLVVASLSGFGRGGPQASRPGHDLSLAARAGLLGLTTIDGDPVVLGVQVADIGGSLAFAGSILAALVGRFRGGRGAVVDVSLTEAAAAFTLVRSVGEGEPLLDGRRAAYTIYPTRDGRHLAVAALEPKFWATFTAAIELDGAGSDGMLGGPEGAALRAQVAEKVRMRSAAQWREVFGRLPACVEPILAPSEVAEDPQLAARGFEGPGGGPRSPLRVGDAESASGAGLIGLRGPELGADGPQILGALGLDSGG